MPLTHVIRVRFSYPLHTQQHSASYIVVRGFLLRFTRIMNYSVKELKNTLIEKCTEEGIYYALVAINKHTKEIVLPQNLDSALKNPDYRIFKCKKTEEGYDVEEVK